MQTSSSWIAMSKPRRGEVWWVDLEPATGAELNKTRPVVVLSAEDAGVLPIKVVAPVTGWSPVRKNHWWLVRVRPTDQNGLKKESCVDAMQVRGVSLKRFRSRLGVLSPDDLVEVVTAVALAVGYESEQA